MEDKFCQYQHLTRWIICSALFQVNMEDKFGQVMMDNLRARDCLLHTEYCSSLQSQIER